MTAEYNVEGGAAEHDSFLIKESGASKPRETVGDPDAEVDVEGARRDLWKLLDLTKSAEKRPCGKCGAEMSPGDRFCPECHAEDGAVP